MPTDTNTAKDMGRPGSDEASGGRTPKSARTMTLNLSEREMAAVERLSGEAEMSKTALIRQALRLYEMISARIRAGETMTFSGDAERVALFVGPGWDPVAREYDIAAQHNAFRAKNGAAS